MKLISIRNELGLTFFCSESNRTHLSPNPTGSVWIRIYEDPNSNANATRSESNRIYSNLNPNLVRPESEPDCNETRSSFTRTNFQNAKQLEQFYCTKPTISKIAFETRKIYQNESFLNIFKVENSDVLLVDETAWDIEASASNRFWIFCRPKDYGSPHLSCSWISTGYDIIVRSKFFLLYQFF